MHKSEHIECEEKCEEYKQCKNENRCEDRVKRACYTQHLQFMSDLNVIHRELINTVTTAEALTASEKHLIVGDFNLHHLY